MQNGLIMQIERRFVIVLTPDGDFIKVKRSTKRLKLGMEITFSLEENREFNFYGLLKMPNLRSSLAFVSVFVLFFAFYLHPSKNNNVYAYMSVDINPSMELEVNPDMQVLKIDTLNKDAETVKGCLTDWYYQPASKVTVEVISESKRLGFLKGDKQVLVSATLNDESNNNSLKEITSYIHSITNEVGATITAFYSPSKLRSLARNKGISTGKLALVIKSRKNGFNITEDEVKNKSITDIEKELNVSLVALLGNSVSDSEVRDFVGGKYDRFLADNTNKDATKTNNQYAVAVNSNTNVFQNSSVVKQHVIMPSSTSVVVPSGNTAGVVRRYPNSTVINKSVSVKTESSIQSTKTGQGTTANNTNTVQTPNTSSLQDSYVAGIKYGGSNSQGNTSTTTPTTTTTSAGNPTQTTNTSADSSSPNSSNTNQTTNASTSSNDANTSTSTSTTQSISAQCASDEYYYEDEQVMFFEDDEEHNIVPVWKTVPIKKLCQND